MTDDSPSSTRAPSLPVGRWGAVALAAAGGSLILLGAAVYLGLAAGERGPVRFAGFVAVPLAVVASFALSRWYGNRWLYLVVALLDLEGIVLGDVPVGGVAYGVTVPLVGVALVTHLLPTSRLRLPYLAAWVASTIGVTMAVLGSPQPAVQIAPRASIVPAVAIVDAVALALLWLINDRRTRALMAVTEAESRFRDLLEGVDLIAVFVDPDQRIAFLNDYALRLTGWTREEVEGLNWYDTFVTEERREASRARYQRIVAGREEMEHRRESSILTRSGERRLIRWSHVGRHDAAGRYAGLAGIGEDITAARRAQEEARRVSDLLKAVVEGSPLPIAFFDNDLCIRLWNPAAQALFGLTADEAIGRRLPDLIAEGGREALAAEVTGALGSSDLPRGVLVNLTRRDGRELVLRLYGTPQLGPDGQPVGFVGQVIDMTAQQAMEEQLREAQKMEAVGRLAGGVAHDFNNSLTAIGGMAALIAAATDDPEIREDAETIAASVRRAGNLTRELLAYSRRSLLQPQTVEVNALVGAIRPMLRRLLGEDVAVVIESGVPEAMVRADPGQLEQAILNLAVNARDAMPDGGRLTIATGRRPVAESDGEGGASWVVISVGDTGSGIAPELQSQVFDPFFTTKPVGAGTGLGLAMVQGFVVQSGGRVALRSELSAGTTVEILLPEVAGPSSASAVAPQPPASAGGGETILFVEDEPAVAAAGFQVLSRRGYRVLLADSGATAIALLNAHTGPIALLLADVILPDMRGPQVAEAAARTHPEAALLYASGYSADTFVRRGELEVTVDLIEKPYSPEQLALRVRSVIERKHAEDAGDAAEPAADAAADPEAAA